MNEAYELPVLEVFDNDGNRIPIPGFAIPYVLTNEDKATIVQSVVESIGVPVFGTIGNDKTITLNEGLPDGVYTLRYLTDDGYANIGTITVGNVIPDGPNEPDVPQEPTAPDTTIDWSLGTKIESDGAITEGTATYSASNFIKIVDGYTYTFHKPVTADSAGVKICYYSGDKNENYISTSGDLIAQTSEAVSAEIPLIDGAMYFRIRLYATVTQVPQTAYSLTAEAVSG